MKQNSYLQCLLGHFMCLHLSLCSISVKHSGHASRRTFNTIQCFSSTICQTLEELCMIYAFEVATPPSFLAIVPLPQTRPAKVEVSTICRSTFFATHPCFVFLYPATVSFASWTLLYFIRLIRKSV